MSDHSRLKQRDITRSQSTADISHETIFLFNNTFQKAVLSNASGNELTLVPGSFVIRDTTTPTQVKPVTALRDFDDVIGIVSTDGALVISDGATADITYCTSGDIDEGLLSFPENTTLDSIPARGKKSFRDILGALGFTLYAVTNHTKFDN